MSDQAYKFIRPPGLEKRLGCGHSPKETVVEVHVTPTGGRYVNPDELIRSDSVKKVLDEVRRVSRFAVG